MKENTQKLTLLIFALVLLQSSSTGRPIHPAEAAPQPTATSTTSTTLLREGLALRDRGQHDRSAAAFQDLLRMFPQSTEAELAQYSLAESAFLRQDWAAAIALLQDFLDQSRSQDLRSRALFLLARSYENTGRHQQAVAAYEQYESSGAPLAGYAAVRRAAQLEALGRKQEAAAAYEQGALAAIAPEQRALALEAAVRLRDDAGQSAEALTNVERILDFARIQGYRNKLLLDAAQRALQLGKPSHAGDLLREIVEQSPASGQALKALELLQTHGMPVAALAAGKVLLAHEQYEQAIVQLDAALAGEHSSEQRAQARRQRALAIRGTGDYERAEAELRALAESPVGRQALLDAIQTHGWTGDIEGAKAGYRAFAEQYPDDPRAPEALRRVVELTARSGDQAAVTQAQLELGRRHPSSRQGQQALIAAALFSFQQGLYQQSRSAWQLLADGNRGQTRAQGLYWAGRLTNDLGEPAAAGELLREAYSEAPDSYYGARAAELLGISETVGLEPGAPLTNAYRQTGMLWIASWYSPDTPSHHDSLPEVVRARELEHVHLLREAASEWKAARAELEENPIALYRLGLEMHDSGNARAAMEFAAALVRQAPASAGPTPVALRRLLYPTPWAELVSAESARYGVDPLLLYSIMRQESRFDPRATSWVGARGLMQVMPSTGEGIAANLQVAGFKLDDLYNPATSIRFGAFYIDAQVQSMSGSLHGGMAAYNGGLGNALRWADGDIVPDPDLFLLTIDFRETRHYVEICYANYGAYKRLYK